MSEYILTIRICLFVLPVGTTLNFSVALVVRWRLIVATNVLSYLIVTRILRRGRKFW